MKRLSFATILVALFFLAVPAQDANAQVKIGPRVGIDVGDDLDSPFIGAEVRFLAGDLPVTFVGSFDYYFIDDETITFGGQTVEADNSAFTLDFNALYMFGIDNEAFTPYAGGGLGITRGSTDFNGESESNTEVNLNVVGGAEFPLDAVTPFVQAQFGIGGDFERFNIAGGILFNI